MGRRGGKVEYINKNVIKNIKNNKNVKLIVVRNGNNF